MKTRTPALCLLAAFPVAIAGCGKTERSGAVGEKLSAKGLEVTVEEVDTGCTGRKPTDRRPAGRRQML